MNIEAAQKVIAREKQERAEKAKQALDALCKEYNVEIMPVVMLNDVPVPVAQILNFPAAITINAK